MPRTRPAYSPEYREQIVALVRSGRSVEDLAREFEPCAHTIYAWIRQAEEAGNRGPAGLMDDEREELKRLRRENKKLREERDILSKAAAWFANSDATSSRSSSS
ncbi:MAG: transposase [Pseudomonadota bacterium]